MKKFLIILITFVFLFSAVGVEASIFGDLPKLKVMPDNPAYFLKIWYEKIIVFISFGNAKKAERYSELAEKRLYEAKQMAEKGKEELSKKALEEYQKYLDKANSMVDKIKEQAKEAAKQKAKEELTKVIDEIEAKINQLVEEWKNIFIKK